MYPVSQKVGLFYFHDNFGISGPLKFRKNLRRKLELKLSPRLKSVAALPCET